MMRPSESLMHNGDGSLMATAIQGDCTKALRASWRQRVELGPWPLMELMFKEGSDRIPPQEVPGGARNSHQTGCAGWLFVVPKVGYIAINQPEITNLTITNLWHYVGWLFQITDL